MRRTERPALRAMALVAHGMGEEKALVFVAAMLAGMGLFALFDRRISTRAANA